MRETRPRVGLIPTIESRYAGTMVEPDVSVPIVVAAIELAAAIADPLEEPPGSPLS